MITTRNLRTSIQDIKNTIDPLEIYKFYSDKPISTASIISSPLRKDDDPSFKIWEDGHFYDHATGQRGDVIDFVKLKLGVNFSQAIKQILKDFGNYEYQKIEILNSTSEKSIIKPFFRAWNKGDKEFWSKFHISKKTLELFEVFPVSFYEINGYRFKADKLAYCFKTGSRFKIYQPYSEKFKFIGNTNENSIFGFPLIKKGKSLYICASLKDAAVLTELKYDAIAPNSESSRFKRDIMEILFELYDDIFVVFDWDKAGYNLSDEFMLYYREFPLKQIKISAPEKDIAEFSERFGLEATNKLLINEKNKMGFI